MILIRMQQQNQRQHLHFHNLVNHHHIQGKSFGEKAMEEIVREYFKLDKRDKSGHDHKKWVKHSNKNQQDITQMDMIGSGSMLK
jgi:hypothetical protein